MICYKLVEKGTRLSSNAGLIRERSGFEVLHKYLHNTETRKFILKYEAGKVVEAVKSSVGIFCFDTEQNAKRFAHNACFSSYMIVKVKPLTRKRKVKQIVQGSILLENLVHKTTLTTFLPTGTLFFTKVLVLE